MTWELNGIELTSLEVLQNSWGFFALLLIVVIAIELPRRMSKNQDEKGNTVLDEYGMKKHKDYMKRNPLVPKEWHERSIAARNGRNKGDDHA